MEQAEKGLLDENRQREIHGYTQRLYITYTFKVFM